MLLRVSTGVEQIVERQHQVSGTEAQHRTPPDLASDGHRPMLPLDLAFMSGQGNILMMNDATVGGINKPATHACTMPQRRVPRRSSRNMGRPSCAAPRSLQLFIARHSDSALAKKAGGELL
jgi:hypothetical protein